MGVKKKVVVFGLVLIMGIVGCTSGNETATPTLPPSADPTPAPSEAPEPSENICTPQPEAADGFLDIPTYDGSGQATHFNVQFAEEGFQGHTYWMTMTPYPFEDGSKENPSVLVSKDGRVWTEPVGITNPVSGVPQDADRKGHYSDGYLLRGPEGFELWFRYNPAKDGQIKPDNSHNLIYRMTSPDGINWSEKETVFDGNGQAYMSPSLLFEDGLYRLWYSNYGGAILYTESSDLKSWTEPAPVEIELTDGYVPWHQEIVATDLGLEALVLGYQPNGSGGSRFALFYTQSQDGLNLGQGRLIDPVGIDPALAGYHFYKSSLVKHCGEYRLYLAVVAPNGVWGAYLKQVPEAGLEELFT
ncbi:MAG: hypothetical protein LBH68_02460 [Bifidobacteriaceae bacterium]|jgi:hypothetical protein|nr:hypothetical protein [Bifidobacteriaceae bacterium]